MKKEVVEATGLLFGDSVGKVKKKREFRCTVEERRLALAFLRKLRSGERVARIVGDSTPEYAVTLKHLGIQVQVRSDDQGLCWFIVYDSPEVIE